MLTKVRKAIKAPNLIFPYIKRTSKGFFKKYYFCFVNPNTAKYWDSMLSNYDSFWRNENYFHVLELFPKDEAFSVLDIGCALGDGCELLQKNFPLAKISGADLSKVGIEKAKKKSKTINYFIMNILNGVIPRAYDYITIIETLEHFDNPFLIVNKCLNHVKKSLIISVPYTPEFTGKRIDYVVHRYHFNEGTFIAYKARVVKITDFVEVTGSKCIIYEIFPD